MTRRTAKYEAACRLTRTRGDNARVYAAVARLGFAWDASAGWYRVDERATGKVKVRLEGTFPDLVAYAQRIGLDLEPSPGRKHVWLAYGETKSGASPARKPAPRTERSRPTAAPPSSRPPAPATPAPARTPARPRTRTPPPRPPTGPTEPTAPTGRTRTGRRAPARMTMPIGFTGNALREEMRAAAKDEDFETAAELRDRAGLKPRGVRR